MVRFRLFALSFALITTIAFAPLPARADEKSDKAAAEALYQLAQQLMSAGDFENACPKLDASNALDPGVGTLLLLGDCQEKLGKLASAWAAFREAAQLATSRNDSERARVAEIRAAALKPRLVSVVYKVEKGNDVPGFELRQSGALISKGSWGVGLPVDSGRYDLVASAPDRENWHSALDVPAKLEGPLIVHVPLLRPLPSEARTAAPAAAPRIADQPDPSNGNAQRTWGVVIGAVGTAALITSGVMTFLATQKNTDSKDSCDSTNPNLCTPEGVAQRKDAQDMARLATFVGIGGGVVLAGGTLLYFTAPRAETGRITGLSLRVGARF
jgi:hypothetical protein